MRHIESITPKFAFLAKTYQSLFDFSRLGPNRRSKSKPASAPRPMGRKSQEGVCPDEAGGGVAVGEAGRGVEAAARVGGMVGVAVFSAVARLFIAKTYTAMA